MASAETIPVNVSSRVLRHISRGIYRTPAGALKELISNAYDAGAANVTVNTGWPTVLEMVITDDGEGMTVSGFKDIVQHIGFSKKLAGEEFEAKGGRRVTIGHYGIGLLAVGQLAQRMTVISKTAGSTSGFTAEIDFDQFELVKNGPTVRARIRDEKAIERKDKHVPNQVFSIGKCTLRHNRYDGANSKRSFTRITLTGIREFVPRHLVGDLPSRNPKWSKAQDYAPNYSAILKILREHEGEISLGWYPYERLLWELGVYCPVSYPNIGPFRSKGKLSAIARLAAAPSFSLRIDGLHIRKPFEETFFSDEGTDVENIFTWNEEPFSDDLHTSGYLIFKRQIRPRAIQGLLVRENGVAVGLYDTTYLHYPFNEGQKFNQLTGEIYTSGLSGALNIDRNSFNETDDRYIALCKWVHEKLQTDVFKWIKAFQSGTEAPRRTENRHLVSGLLENASVLMKTKIKQAKYVSSGRAKPLLSVRGSTLLINQDHPDGSGSGASREKVLLAAALVMARKVSPEEIERTLEIVRKARTQAKGRNK